MTKRRDRKAALKFLRKTMKRHGQPKVIVADKLRSYGAGLKDLGMPDDRETGRRRCPLFNPQLVQRRARPHQPRQFQGQPRRRSRGFCVGIICDGRITSEEARKIHVRFHKEPVLRESSIFSRLRWAVDAALTDAVLDANEAEEIRDWIAALVTDGHADTGVGNIGGVVAPDDPITNPDDVLFNGRAFVLTGKMSIGPRFLIGDELSRRGAVLKPSVTNQIDFIVVSNTASLHWKTTHFGTKIEEARARIAARHHMRFVTERALAEALSRKVV